jgi:hypothetical protein
MWRGDLEAYVAWYDQHDAAWQARHCDDDPINEWVFETNRDVWHPLPTIVDHDNDVPSTHEDPMPGNFSAFTWRDFSRHEVLDFESYWDNERDPPLLQPTSEEARLGLKEGYWNV